MALFRSTTYKEHLGESGNASPELSIAVDSGQVSRVIQVIPGTHASIWQAARDFLGYAELQTDGVTNWISRITPHAYPPAPWLYCTRMPRSEGMAFTGVNNEAAEYQISKHNLLYQALTYNVVSDEEVTRGLGDQPDEGEALALGWDYSRYITKAVKPSAKLLVLNRGIMEGVKADVGGATKPLLEGFPFVEPCAQVEYVWHAVPSNCVPWALHALSLGTVNNATFDNYPAETLRVDSIEPIARRDPFGARIYDIVFKMQFLPRVGNTLAERGTTPTPAPTARGHNWVYAAHEKKFIVMRISEDGSSTGKPPFRPADFTAMFRPTQP